MILDGLLAWSINQAITATAVSTNIIDLGVGTPTNPALPTFARGGGARDIGIGDDPAMKILVQVTTTLLGATSLLATLQGAPDNGAGAPAAFTNWYSDATAVPVASLTAGMRLLDMDMPRPGAGQPVPRFLQLNYTVAGGPFTSGNVSAFLVLDRDDQMYNGNFVNVYGGYVPGIVIAN